MERGRGATGTAMDAAKMIGGSQLGLVHRPTTHQFPDSGAVSRIIRTPSSIHIPFSDFLTDSVAFSALDLQLFDGVRLVGANEALRGRATQRRRLAVLAFLALSPRRTATRERIMGLLWPEQGPEVARRNLNEALYVIRRELGAEVIETRGDDLTLAAAVDCDVDRFERLVATGRTADAVRTCPGPLFGTWSVGDAPEYEQWAESARERFARRFVTLGQEAARAAMEHGAWAAGAELYARVRQADPDSVTGVEGEARALAAGGEPLRGLRVLDDFAERWQREFGSGPPAGVAAARAEIARGSGSVTTPAIPTPVIETAAPPSQEPIVERVAEPAAAPASAVVREPSFRSAEPPVVSGRRRPSTHRLLQVIGATAVVAIAAVFAMRRGGAAPLPSAPAAASRVAILATPLARPDSTLGYLRDVLTTGVIRQLRTNAVPVASVGERQAVEEGRITLDSLIALRQIGTVVELDYTLRDEQLQAAARVLDPSTRELLETRVFVRPPADALAIETELVQFVVDALRRRLRQNLVLRDTALGPRNDYARKLLITAARKREDGEAAGSSGVALDRAAADALLASADSLLVRALVQEPRWASLWVERARIVRARLQLAPDRVHGPWYDSAMAFVDSALAVDPERATAYETRGLLHRLAAMTPTGTERDSLNLQAAARDLQRATAIEPQRAESWLGLSLVHMLKGEPGAAAAAARHAIEQDAFLRDGEGMYFAVFAAALLADDTEDALRWCRQGRLVYPGDVRFHQCELAVMRQQTPRPDDEGRAGRLVAVIDSLLPRQRVRDPYFPLFGRAVAAGITARAGNHARARRELAWLELRVRGDSAARRDFQMDRAWIHLQLGDTARAEAVLRQMMQEKPNTRRQLLAFPMFRALLPTLMGAPVVGQPTRR